MSPPHFPCLKLFQTLGRIIQILNAVFLLVMFFHFSCFLSYNRASDYPWEYDGACLQMRLSYSPCAHIFLFLVQWADCNLAGVLGLIRILIYKVIIFCFMHNVHPMLVDQLHSVASVKIDDVLIIVGIQGW